MNVIWELHLRATNEQNRGDILGYLCPLFRLICMFLQKIGAATPFLCQAFTPQGLTACLKVEIFLRSCQNPMVGIIMHLREARKDSMTFHQIRTNCDVTCRLRVWGLNFHKERAFVCEPNRKCAAHVWKLLSVRFMKNAVLLIMAPRGCEGACRCFWFFFFFFTSSNEAVCTCTRHKNHVDVPHAEIPPLVQMITLCNHKKKSTGII